MVAADVLAALTRSKSGIMLCSTLQLLQTIYRRCTPGFIEKFQELLLSRAVALLLLKNALFNKLQRARRLATELLHTMAESCPEVQQLLTRVLPKVHPVASSDSSLVLPSAMFLFEASHACAWEGVEN